MAKTEHSKAARALALALCVCLVAVLAGSALYLSAHSHHRCDAPSCQVCLHLRQASSALAQLRHAFAGLAFGLLAVVAAVALFLACPAFLAATPVGRRVRMND